ncbi:MAG: hypothetical protein OXC37_02900, partial [Bdellovibrionaceae bacterium]|nr:hypothetical protein [Pseudobdellovibrionaceae bacterium]
MKMIILKKLISFFKPIIFIGKLVIKSIHFIIQTVTLLNTYKKIKKNLLITLSLFCIFPSLLKAQDIEKIEKEIILNVDSKKLAQQQALNEISITLVSEIIGEKRYKENKTKIEKSIIKNQNRY